LKALFYQKDLSTESQKSDDRFDTDQNNRLDNVTVHDVEMFRLERMSEQTFWLKVYKKNGEIDHVFWLHATYDKDNYAVIVVDHEVEDK